MCAPSVTSMGGESMGMVGPSEPLARGPLEAEARWKGVLASACRAAALELLGDKPVAEFEATLSHDAQAFLNDRFLATAWYRETASGEVVEKLAVALGESESSIAQQVGARTVALSAGQFGRWLLQFFATPERFAGYSSQVWSRLRDGELTSTLNGEIITCELRNWHGHHPLSCLATVGAMDELGKNMRGVHWLGSQRTACVAFGAASCKFELAFQR